MFYPSEISFFCLEISILPWIYSKRKKKKEGDNIDIVHPRFSDRYILNVKINRRLGHIIKLSSTCRYFHRYLRVFIGLIST